MSSIGYSTPALSLDGFFPHLTDLWITIMDDLPRMRSPMTKFTHDDFAKSYLTELLNTIGKAVPDRRIKSESRFAD
jgi:hypothetical protein